MDSRNHKVESEPGARAGLLVGAGATAFLLGTLLLAKLVGLHGGPADQQQFDVKATYAINTNGEIKLLQLFASDSECAQFARNLTQAGENGHWECRAGSALQREENRRYEHYEQTTGKD